MRKFTLVFLLLGAFCEVFGQNNQIVLQGGGTLTGRRELRLPSNITLPGFSSVTLRENNGYAAGILYDRRLAGRGAASLWLQAGIFAVQATNDQFVDLVRPVLGNTTGVSGFLTPALMVKFLPEARLSPYVLGGAGYAQIVEAELTSTSPVRGSFENSGTWAVTYGGGADLRLWRWLALRGELRNFYTGRPSTSSLLLEDRQRNTLVLTGGVGFRF